MARSTRSSHFRSSKRLRPACPTRLSGYIDAQNMIARVETKVEDAVVGDMLVEQSYSGYKDFGGVKFPAKIVQTRAGLAWSDFSVTDVKANAPAPAPPAPRVVALAVAAQLLKDVDSSRRPVAADAAVPLLKVAVRQLAADEVAPAAQVAVVVAQHLKARRQAAAVVAHQQLLPLRRRNSQTAFISSRRLSQRCRRNEGSHCSSRSPAKRNDHTDHHCGSQRKPSRTSPSSLWSIRTHIPITPAVCELQPLRARSSLRMRSNKPLYEKWFTNPAHSIDARQAVPVGEEGEVRIHR